MSAAVAPPLRTIFIHFAGVAARAGAADPALRSSIHLLSFLNTVHVCRFRTTLHTPFLQALLPVPPFEQLPPHLQQLWGSTNSFSMRFWPTLCSVRALSNCSLVVLDADKFAELLKEYDWVSSYPTVL
jgi:CRP-like cAMP-binding protein